MAGGTGKMIQLRDGAALWTAVSGTGPVFVCCHGGPGLWDYLSARHSTVAASPSWATALA